MGTMGERVWAAAGAVVTQAAVMASLLLNTGCEPEPLFEACEFPPSILAACEATVADGSTTLTCVASDHPSCLDSVCAAWEGGAPFCTKVCSTAADCPAESTCEQHLDLLFCVPLGEQAGGAS